MIQWALNYGRISDYHAFEHPDYGLFLTTATSNSTRTRYIGIRSVSPGPQEPIEWVGWWTGGSVPEALLDIALMRLKVCLVDELERHYGIAPELPF
jgi:hypothetical protein